MSDKLTSQHLPLISLTHSLHAVPAAGMHSTLQRATLACPSTLFACVSCLAQREYDEQPCNEHSLSVVLSPCLSLFLSAFQSSPNDQAPLKCTPPTTHSLALSSLTRLPILKLPHPGSPSPHDLENKEETDTRHLRNCQP